MKDYFIGIVVTMAIAVAFGAIAYGGKRDGWIKMAFGVLITYSVLVPILSIAPEEEEITVPRQDISDFTEDYIDVCENAYADGVRQYIADRYALDKQDVSVTVYGFDFDSMRAERIKVILSGRAALADRHGIEERIEAEGLGRCEVEIRIG